MVREVKSKSKKKSNLIIKHRAIAVIILLVVASLVLWWLWSLDTSKAAKDTVCTHYSGIGGMVCMSDYMGLKADDAMSKAKKDGLYPQIAKQNGDNMAVVDIGGPVVYFEVENDLVTGGGFNEYRNGGGIRGGAVSHGSVDTGNIPVLTDKDMNELAGPQAPYIEYGNAGALDGELVRTMDKSLYGGLWIGNDAKLHIGIVGTDAKANEAARAAVAAAGTRGIRSENVSVDRVRNSWKLLNDANWAIAGLVQKYIDLKHGAVSINVGIKTDLNRLQVDIPSDARNMTDGHKKVMKIIEEKYNGVVFYHMSSSSGGVVAQ